MPLTGGNMKSGSVTGPVEVLIVAVAETAGSALYGMVDVLLAAGNIWQALTGTQAEQHPFRVRIVAPGTQPFSCGNRIPVNPDCPVSENPEANVLILPELWLGPDEDIRGRYPELMEWIRNAYHAGASIYSACSGAVMLAETGLLDGCDATSHWGYQDLFRQRYPKVRFRPPDTVIGRRTEACMESGVFLSAVYAIDGIVQEIEKEWGRPDTLVVATGGYAPLMARYCSTVEKVEPFGAFVEIGAGLTGLLHVSQMSYQRVEDPTTLVQPGQLVEVPGASRREIVVEDDTWQRLLPVLDELSDSRMAMPLMELDQRLTDIAYKAHLADPGTVNALSLWHSYVVYLVRQGIDASSLTRRVGAITSDLHGALMNFSPAGGNRALSSIEFTYPALRS